MLRSSGVGLLALHNRMLQDCFHVVRRVQSRKNWRSFKDENGATPAECGFSFSHRVSRTFKSGNWRPSQNLKLKVAPSYCGTAPV